MSRQRVNRVWVAEELVSKEDLAWAFTTYGELTGNPPRNLFERLKLWKRVGDILTRRIQGDMKFHHDLVMALEAYERGEEFMNSNLPWGENEDQLLVNARAAGEDIAHIAHSLGRTPAAVATRLSQLVGVPREFIRVDGKRIEGELNNQEVDGKFTGVVHRS